MSKPLFSLTGLFLLAASAVAPANDGLIVDKHIAIMRHGVRPQTNSKKLEAYPQTAWPKWDVADGMLTAHGAAAARRLAEFEVTMLREEGLVPASGCPAPGTVFGWANGAVRRTIDTGNVLLESMFPGCGLSVGHNQVTAVDPLYAASDVALGAIDPDTAKAAILAAAGGGFDALQAKAAPLMRELEAMLGCEGKDSPCSMTNRPWKIKVQPADADHPAEVSVKGPIDEAGTLVQVFLLQYANGFPLDQVAFGTVKGAEDIIRLSALRQIKYDIGNRVPYLARRDASNFLNQILLSLAAQPAGAATEAGAAKDGARSTKGSDDPVPAENGPGKAHFALFMASDTQQAEVATMLGLHWHIPPYLDDETPPTGALTFERLHNEKGKAYVRLGFIAPTLDQIREASVLDRAHPPLMARIDITGCEAESQDGACPLERFMTIARATLDPTAIAPQLYH